jgi:hypothetical protein
LAPLADATGIRKRQLKGKIQQEALWSRLATRDRPASRYDGR